MIKIILSKPILMFKVFLVKRRAKQVYLPHLEADYCRLKIQEEMRRLYPETWA